MIEFKPTDGGLLVPDTKKKPPEEPIKKRNGFPILSGWSFTKCDSRRDYGTDDKFRRWVLENLYIIVEPGGGGIKLPGYVEDKERLTSLVDELAVALVGGVPEDWEEYT